MCIRLASAGKTSLLNILMGESDPTEGSVSRHLGCRITMLQQHHYKGEQLDPNLSPLEHMRRLPQEDSSAVAGFPTVRIYHDFSSG